jgi:hypothetical protein
MTSYMMTKSPVGELLLVGEETTDGADGTMRGYAGGVERKQWLLVHEGILLPEFA